MKAFKISFCVVCMNRLHQLKKTLLQNIEDNKDYNNYEFIVLDYNSQDGMEEWIHKNMLSYIEAGRIKYYRTLDPLVFNHSHSKNMAFKLATGEIVCNVNADHFTGKSFAKYVNEQFNNNDGIVITPIDFYETNLNHHPSRDVMGKVCVKKSVFNEITGFDEAMGTYGFEDYDFINRLELIGVKRVLLEDTLFLNYLSHTDEERYSSDVLIDNLYALYIRYKTPSETELLFLYKNNVFEQGILINNRAVNSDNPQNAYLAKTARYEFSREETTWKKDMWYEDNFCLNLPNKQLIKEKANGLDILTETDNAIFYRIVDIEVIKDIMRFMLIYLSRTIMEQNLMNKKVKVNNGFGQGNVYKNFDLEKQLYL